MSTFRKEITMKPNQTKYLLGIALIAIWGLLGMRVYSKYDKQNHPIQLAATSTASIAITESQPFQLTEASYRDPFLDNKLKKTKSKSASSGTRNISTSQPKRLKKSKPVKFPTIAYKGHIVLKTGRQAAVLKVGAELINLGIGNDFAEVRLLKLYPDSIRVSYQGVEKTILKAK